MKVFYDDEVDAMYIELSDAKPDGVIEISDGMNIDITSGGKIVGIEIIHASEKIDLSTMFSYSLNMEKEIDNKSKSL